MFPLKIEEEKKRSLCTDPDMHVSYPTQSICNPECISVHNENKINRTCCSIPIRLLIIALVLEMPLVSWYMYIRTVKSK